MNLAPLPCSQEECKHKRQNLTSLSYEAVSKQLEACEKCENGLFKKNPLAAETYHIIAMYWAQMHNAFVGKSIGSRA